MKLINLLRFTPLDANQKAEGLSIQDVEDVVWVNPKYIVEIGKVSKRGFHLETRAMTFVELTNSRLIYTRESVNSVLGRVFNDVNLSDWDGIDEEWNERTEAK